MHKALAAGCKSSVAVFWHLSTFICTFYIKILEKDSIGVYNYVGGVK